METIFFKGVSSDCEDNGGGDSNGATQVSSSATLCVYNVGFNGAYSQEMRVLDARLKLLALLHNYE